MDLELPGVNFTNMESVLLIPLLEKAIEEQKNLPDDTFKFGEYESMREKVVNYKKAKDDYLNEMIAPINKQIAPIIEAERLRGVC